MITKILSLFVLICALGIAWLYFDDFKSGVIRKIELPLLSQQLIQLQKKQLGYTKELGSIKSISYLSRLENSKIDSLIQKNLSRSFKTRSNGQFELEVEVFDDVDPNTSESTSDNKNEISNDIYQKKISEKSPTQNGSNHQRFIILQFSLIELKSSNKVGEFGFRISDHEIK